MTFTHRDINIFLDSRGRFCFAVNGTGSANATLAACKKAIDAHLDSTFVRFQAYNCNFGEPSLDVVTVVGTETVGRNTRYRRQRLHYLLEGGARTTSIIPITPQNKKLIRRYLTLSRRLEASIRLQKNALQKALDAINVLADGSGMEQSQTPGVESGAKPEPPAKRPPVRQKTKSRK